MHQVRLITAWEKMFTCYLASNMDLKIRLRTVGYNNKILVSDEKFILGKNEKVNLTAPAIKNHKVTQTAFRPEPRKRNSNDVLLHAPNISHKSQEPKTITHNDEKIALVLSLAGGFAI